MHKHVFTWLGAVGISCTLATGNQGRADEADAFFDNTYVHEIRITFEDPNWYDVLYDSHANDPDDPYFPARFEYGATVLDPVGVRFKGNSSFSIPTVKKSFKIDFDEYHEDDPAWRFLGLKKLNLNNSFKDPTMLREKVFLVFAGNYVPTVRAVHSRLYVNETYWGLYVAVEQVDKTFFQERIGGSEDGSLFKGEPQGTLEWLGSDPAPYKNNYELKTNETEDDWTDLINLIDVLNNTPASPFWPTSTATAWPTVSTFSRSLMRCCRPSVRKRQVRAPMCGSGCMLPGRRDKRKGGGKSRCGLRPQPNCGTGVSPVVFTVRNGVSEPVFSPLPRVAIWVSFGWRSKPAGRVSRESSTIIPNLVCRCSIRQYQTKPFRRRSRFVSAALG